METVKLVVVVADGVVQQVMSAGVEIDCIVIDYDLQSDVGPYVRQIPQGYPNHEGEYKPASVDRCDAGIDTAFVEHIFTML
jgi:hypothetical protein